MAAYRAAIAGDRLAIRAAGGLIIEICGNYTTTMQPIIVDGELAYGITSYGSDELVIVYDNDDLPLLEGFEECDRLPPGMRKAALLETKMHLENVKKYGLDDDTDTSEYESPSPAAVYRRWLRKERIKNGTSPLGRLYHLWVSLLNRLPFKKSK